MKVKITARVDFEALRKLPVSNETEAFVEFDCGWFRCDTPAEIVGMIIALRNSAVRLAVAADFGIDL